MTPSAWHVMPQVMAILLKANDELHAMTRHLGMERSLTAHYVRDFRTIKVDYGQRTGKTVYVKQAAQPEDLIVVANEEMVAYYAEGEGARCEVVVLSTLVHQALHVRIPKRYPRVWLDGVWDTVSGLRTHDRRLRFYRSMVYDADQQFIVIGL